MRTKTKDYYLKKNPNPLAWDHLTVNPNSRGHGYRVPADRRTAGQVRSQDLSLRKFAEIVMESNEGLEWVQMSGWLMRHRILQTGKGN